MTWRYAVLAAPPARPYTYTHIHTHTHDIHTYEWVSLALEDRNTTQLSLEAMIPFLSTYFPRRYSVLHFTFRRLYF